MKHKITKFHSWLLDQNGKKFLKLVLAIIVAISIYLIFVPPYIGMANNGIFQTIIQNVGIDYSYNPWDENYFNESFFTYVVNSFIITEPVDNGTYIPFEINVKFSKLISELFSKTGHYDLRYMGLSNLIFYIIALSLLLYAVSHYSKKIIYTTGIICLLLACDTYIIQYFNSFYVELGTLLYIITFFALTLIYINSNKKIKILCYLFEIPIGIIIVNIIPRDNILLLPFIALLLTQGIDLIKKLNFKKVYSILLLLIITISLIVPSIYINKKNHEDQKLKSYNVLMKTILPLSSNPKEHLQDMGFNEAETNELMIYLDQTAENSGFEKYGERFNRIKEITILLKEPKVGFQILKQNAAKLFITDDHIGNYLKDENQPYSKNKFSDIWSTLKTYIYKSNIWFYFAINGITIVISLYYILKNRKIKSFHEFHLLFILCIINLIQFMAIAFYDINNSIKDYFVVNVVFDIIFLCMLFSLLSLVINPLKKNLRVSIQIYNIDKN